eukprot:scaffold10.g2379.t1
MGLFALLCALAMAAPALAANRTYYIQAELVDWDYLGGSSLDLCRRPGQQEFGDERPAEALAAVGGLGSSYRKGIYREYTDATFTTPVARGEAEAHMGLLGPTLRAAVGDTLAVVFRNALPFNASILPMGLKAGPGAAGEGAAGLASPFGARARSNASVAYSWSVPPAAGPAPGEPPVKLWLYSPGQHLPELQNTGLMGAILVANDAAAFADGVQDVITLWTIFKEKESYLWDSNLGGRGLEQLGLADEADLEAATLRHTVNGYMYCNMPRPQLVVGQRSTAAAADSASAAAGGSAAVGGAAPAAAPAAAAPGGGGGGASPGVVREYYVAAEMDAWDYTPLGGYACPASPAAAAAAAGDATSAVHASSGGGGAARSAGDGVGGPEVREWTPAQAALTIADPAAGRLGSGFVKARFFEYTDATFTQRKERSEADAYLGLLGPVIKAEVGDAVHVVFHNRLPHAASLHPHGVQYEKASEGAPYNDGLPPQPGDAVPPNTTITYNWTVPERTGPGPADPSSIAWLYHSHANEIAGARPRYTYAGLVGAIVIGREGALRPPGLAPADVDREAVLLFSILMELQSLVWPENAALLGLGDARNTTVLEEAAGGPDALAAAYSKHSINGYMYCNQPRLTFGQGERVRFHVLALGTDVDVHSPALAGGAWRGGGVAPALAMMPGIALTADATMDVPGAATLACKVAELVFVGNTNVSIGAAYRKAMYRQYTDATFKLPTPRAKQHGLLGPLLTAEVGRAFELVLRNALDFEINLVIDGGLALAPGSADPGAPLAPGATASYSIGPGPADLSTVAYAYTSSVDPSAHANAGLVGLLVVGRPGAFGGAGAGGVPPPLVGAVPSGVDQLVPLLFAIGNENRSPYLQRNLAAFGIDGSAIEAAGEEAAAAFEESNLMHGINGGGAMCAGMRALLQVNGDAAASEAPGSGAAERAAAGALLAAALTAALAA